MTQRPHPVSLFLTLALALTLGVGAQWAADRLRLPSIVLMLVAGLAVGPGLGTAKATTAAVRDLVQQIDAPLVLDADGINAFAGAPEAARHANRGVVAAAEAERGGNGGGHARRARGDVGVRVERAVCGEPHGDQLILEGELSAKAFHLLPGIVSNPLRASQLDSDLRFS